MYHLVLCPGSRSGPIAIAAAILNKNNDLKISTAIDERSAAYLGLGFSAATGVASVVITTSGSAVAHLLPAAVEADRSCLPLLFLTADRPIRLKECGANQTVNQQDFLKSVCRAFAQGPEEGAHSFSLESLGELVEYAWSKAHGFAGPVHINLPLEEPLYPSSIDQESICSGWEPESFVKEGSWQYFNGKNKSISHSNFLPLNPYKPGIVIAGPWRGRNNELEEFNLALKSWLSLTGWPVFADPLSGVNINQEGLISNWELLIRCKAIDTSFGCQVMRLGPISSSRILEDWLNNIGGRQLLITEGDDRKLDPLGISVQWNEGLSNWYKRFSLQEKFATSNHKKKGNQSLEDLIYMDSLASLWLDQRIQLEGPINEPALARWIPRLLPEKVSVMISASSPIRDWLCFSGREPLSRRCFGFRGASGIDGTLSLGMGLAKALGPTVLITGDLALLHDSNGWLFANDKNTCLVVFLIDNYGGGIFNQLDYMNMPKSDFDKLFKMPQSVDQIALARAHGIPSRQVACLEDLKSSIEWAFSQNGTVLVRLCTNSESDANLRDQLRKEMCNYLRDNKKSASQ